VLKTNAKRNVKEYEFHTINNICVINIIELYLYMDIMDNFKVKRESSKIQAFL